VSGFEVDSSCDSTTALAVASEACVGQSSCWFRVASDSLGGQDPCVGSAKSIAAVAMCSTAEASLGDNAAVAQTPNNNIATGTDSSNADGLSGGAIAGIVVGSVFGTLLILVASLMVVKRFRAVETV